MRRGGPTSRAARSRPPRPAGPVPLEQRLAHAIAILETVRTTPKPADYLIAQHFKRRPVDDDAKGEIVAWVYDALRMALYFAEIAQEADFPAARAAEAALFLSLRRGRAMRPSDLKRAIAYVANVAPASLEELAAAAEASAGLEHLPDGAERIALLRGFHPWVAERLLGVHSRREVEAILDGLNTAALPCLRVNTTKATREELRERLGAEGIRTKPGRLSPDALIVREGANVFGTEAFREGLFEVQDEGSQVVSLLLGARPGAKVLDACAGACGKALHVAALMGGRGEVYAFDPDARRLANGSRRVRRSGLQNVRVLDSAERYGRFAGGQRGEIDAVLVDAPCTGLGTVRRSPDIKIRATPALLEMMVAKQNAILDTYSAFVRPGGRLVYATCSILSEENTGVVEAFLERNPRLALRPVSEVVSASTTATPALREALASSVTMQLYPHVHGTDGFFAAVLERVS